MLDKTIKFPRVQAVAIAYSKAGIARRKKKVKAEATIKRMNEIKSFLEGVQQKRVSAAAVAKAQEEQPTDEMGQLIQKLDQLVALIGPLVKNQSDEKEQAKEKEPDQEQQSPSDTDATHQQLGQNGFEHQNRFQLGKNQSVDTYQHPSGHQAVVTSKDGKTDQWGIQYSRGLGSPSGKGAEALGQHLSQSGGFLQNEHGRSGKK